MMKKFMSVRVTISNYPSLHNAYVAYSDDELGIDLHYDTTYENGMAQLRKLEKLLNRPAKLVINQFDPAISYKELYGFVDRE